jgi:hypothetical protein
VGDLRNGGFKGLFFVEALATKYFDFTEPLAVALLN